MARASAWVTYDAANAMQIGRELGRRSDQVAAYRQAEQIAARLGRPVVTFHVRADGSLYPGQEGVWSDPAEVQS